MSRVYYSSMAEEDLRAIVRLISRDKPGAARAWAAKLKEACALLASRPKIGELHPEIGIPDCRLFSVGAYVIYYREASDGVEIARILYGGVDSLGR